MSGLVDVVMPVYNAELYLKQSIESIIQQTFSDFTFIIVDDGSTDSSRSILQYYAQQDKRIILLQNNTNSGICLSLNRGIAAGTSKYIVRMDADDISHVDRIQTQTDFMEQHLDVGVCGCDMQCIDEKGDPTFIKKYPSEDKDIRRSLFFFNSISHSGAIIRRDVFDKTTGYDHAYILAEDLMLWFVLGTYSRFANISQTLIDYRIYPNNSTHTKFKKMISQAIKSRCQAVHKYGYNAGILGWLAICLSWGMQFLPTRIVDSLFYKLRTLLS